jgi:aspartyl-tRNA synthetase
MKSSMRTHTCGELNKEHVGKKVVLSGWADSVRQHGKIGFVSIRDRYGITQLFFNDQVSPGLVDLTKESVIQIEGKVNARPEKLVNKEMSTGEVEVSVTSIKVISHAEELPLQINDASITNTEETRLKYRYLDLRTPELQKSLMIRHKAAQYVRDFLNEEGFMEITTPILTKSTPEGARDYLVPSRVHQGKFYALPQSPQQYKQLLMVAGFDKYFQFAPCFRDEAARAHRCPGEFYQIDMEMSFVNQEDILNITEKLMVGLVKAVFPEKKITKLPFPRIKYEDAMKKYGNDSPDIRKDKKDVNELGFCWVVDFPLFQKQSSDDFFHGAGAELGPSHHMFTMPREEDLPLLDTDPTKAKAYQHDLILNGFECGGGSVRIHDPKVQEKIFELIGFTSEQKKQFEHLLTAFKYGVPPHGGIAPGFDRLLMVLMGKENIREVVAFPKDGKARDPVMDAPSVVSQEQLDEIGLKFKK